MSSCKGLKRLHEGIVSKTDLSTLKELDMSFCEALEEFPPIETGAFSNLEILWIYACKGLKQLGEGFASKGAFPALKVLNMSHCGALEEFASTEEGAFPKLKQLWMNNCTGLKQLGEGFASKGAFPALEVLSLSDCIELENFPLIEGGIFPRLEKLWMHNCKHLLQLSEGFASNGAFPALEELNMSDCVALEKFPSTYGGSFPKLRKLGMRNCKSLKELSQGFASKGMFPALQVLNMSHCCALKEFPPIGEGAFPKLEKLVMSNCKGLKHLGKGFASNGAFPVLKELDVRACATLEEFPPIEERAFSQLETLWMHNCTALRRLGEGFVSKGAFPVLKVLNMSNCVALKEFPAVEEGAFPRLEVLWMHNCKGVKKLGDGFALKGALPALKVLNMRNCVALEEFPPTPEGAFPNLKILWMHGCKGLWQVGEGFASKGDFPAFPALRELVVEDSLTEQLSPIEEGVFIRLEYERCPPGVSIYKRVRPLSSSPTRQ
ncbi:unnamed protein product [Calypogeia fissa]